MSLYHTRSKYDDDDTNALRNVVAAFENLNNQMGAIKGFKYTKKIIKFLFERFEDRLMYERLENVKNQKRCDCDEKLEKERGIK